MPRDEGERIRARARLALRAERAMGITSLPIEIGQSEPIAAAPAIRNSPSAPVAPRAVAASAPKPAAKPTPSTALFGTDAPEAYAIPTEPFTAPVLDREKKIVALQTLNESEVRGCTKCRLSETRTNTVFGEGDPDAPIMFIGEGPGENEDQQGRPFVGKAGQLLDKMIGAMGLRRDQVFICNIVKCRPPGNREPAPDETATCTPYLLRQIEVVRPKVIVTLGRPASQYILQAKLSMSKLRGQWHDWRGIKVMPTYHPAYVLRAYTRETREAVWHDLKLVLVELKMPVPARKGE